LFIAEIPLLFEAEYESFFDATVAVIAAEDLCQQRFRQATGYSNEEFAKRSARQLNINEKAERADYVIINNGTMIDLHSAVKQLVNNL
jgi:dephospho-CoA kinase